MSTAVIRRLRDIAALPRWVPEHVAAAWELARGGAELTSEEESQALALLDHPEFYLLWEYAGDLPDDFRVNETNPRLHVLLHGLAETQLLKDDPPEAARAVAHLVGMGVDRHRALHLMLDHLVGEISSILKHRRPADNEAYCRHLERLAQATTGAVLPFPDGRRPGRNDPCPCGSGRKFKRCCGETTALRVDPPLGRMLLSTDYVASREFLERAPDGDPHILIENMSAVARSLEWAGATAISAAAWRRLIDTAAAAGLEDARQQGLLDLQELGLNHPECARDGIWATEQLLASEEHPAQVAQLRLDLADLHERLGDQERADALFQEVMAGDPPEPFCHLRWARRLAEAGQAEAAEEVYRGVIHRDGMGDHEALAHAHAELAEMLEAQGRHAEATALRRWQRRR